MRDALTHSYLFAFFLIILLIVRLSDKNKELIYKPLPLGAPTAEILGTLA